MLQTISRWVAKRQTAFHLWCAETELGAAATSNWPRSMQEKRERTLDLLHKYRQRGEFPENSHEPAACAPCFIDSAGRQCAVAFLMIETGAQAEAAKIARDANFAQIEDMHFDELDKWAGGSGLTKMELARIQPDYPPTIFQLEKYIDLIPCLWVVAALALNSILFNVGRLILARQASVAMMSCGVLFGLVLLGLAWRIDLGVFSHTSELYSIVGNSQLAAFGIAILSIACGIIPAFVRFGKARPDNPDANSVLSPVPPNDGLNEHVKAGEPNPYRTASSTKQPPDERIK
jgi:hypothetical protein